MWTARIAQERKLACVTSGCPLWSVTGHFHCESPKNNHKRKMEHTWMHQILCPNKSASVNLGKVYNGESILSREVGIQFSPLVSIEIK